MIPFYLFLFISSTNGIFLFFERDSYEFFVSESAPINTKIGTIQATSSSSLSIRYELYGDINKTFYLNSTTGILTLSNTLDYETISIYKLTIEARALSSTVAPSFSEIVIHVLNTNDNPPDINVMFYPSVLTEGNVIKYDLNSNSTPLATINIKDLDESTNNLTLFINDTQHFQLQFVRQSKNGLITESIYILSTRNNPHLLKNDHYYLSLYSCDNDQPPLWTNRTYEFHLKPNENLCQFNQTHYIIDIKENLPNRTLILPRLTNQFCQTMVYSIDDTKNFFIQSRTGDLYTSTMFDREEQSIYRLNLQAVDQFNKTMKAMLTIRILDEYGHIPFLSLKKLRLNRREFSSIDLFNSTYCHYQTMVYSYFQLLSNCTLKKLSLPVQGKYLFSVQLNQKYNYEDTFLLELTSDSNETIFSNLVQSQWMIIIPIILSIFLILLLIICAAMIIRRQRYKKQKSSSTLSNSEENVHNKYDAISTLSKLKVHDDHQLSPSPISTAIYIVQKSSSSSPIRDDEGYSGSSDVSENPLSMETTIITANQLVEQYRIHEFRAHQMMSPSDDDSPKRLSTSCVSADVSFV
ncbi:unnamed protein product [Adineta ricciae]|uniref:Cadherin domain-containing protein n=1 Tax=Adineta ricciae TaxID=249248 RepID=A0A816ECX2_ADIRI|nr:unnamed protein product [Adineta ricciae]CAF1651040.1 unnamed protein product [Adineta ricciae]